jgi:hypothetical protein
MKTNEDTRICVVGAGVGGLSAAYFLKQRGYRKVTVLEKLGRVGGLCSSITYRGRSFDLGANYVTLGYPEVLALAEKFGAELYTEGPLRAYDVTTREYSSLLSAVTRDTSIASVTLEAARYIQKRLEISGVLSPDRPGFKGIAEHPELCEPFATWLDKNGMPSLKTLFGLVITLLGYGKLEDIPAAYLLAYMTIPTFLNLSTAGAGVPRSWPKRFTHGFQRLWERISWELDVRLGVDIHDIIRGDVVEVRFSSPSQILDGSSTREQTLEFDRLIVATPLTPDVVGSYLHDLSDGERALLGKILLDPYVVATYESTGLEAVTASTYMLPLPELGKPYVVTRQFSDNDLVSFYTRTDPAGTITNQQVITEIEKLADQMGGRLGSAPYTFDKWPYFPHVSPADMAAGFYDQLEGLQGQKNTYFTGGVLAFELTETIVAYSKRLVADNFPPVK